jgi:hypothetical protein
VLFNFCVSYCKNNDVGSCPQPCDQSGHQSGHQPRHQRQERDQDQDRDSNQDRNPGEGTFWLPKRQQYV